MNYFVRLLTAVALSANCIADEHSGPLVVPIRLVDNLAVVQATINERSVSLYIDSGGHSAIALKPGIVSSNATVDGEGAERYAGADGTVREARRFSVDEVRIAGLPAAELRGSEMIGGPSGVDGYLGYGWLSQYIAVFDYAGGQLRLYEAGQPIPDSECSGPWVALTVDGNLVTSTLETEHGPVTVAWDIGASENVLRRAPAGARRSRGIWPWSSSSLSDLKTWAACCVLARSFFDRSDVGRIYPARRKVACRG
ncbi:MAG: aspartyl protease family protein [Nevskia sp.]|nr:aspartyl protease family protein [Nevskia sp.]